MKTRCPLAKDEDADPPYDNEGIWCRWTDGGHYVVDNIPFFARRARSGSKPR